MRRKALAALTLVAALTTATPARAQTVVLRVLDAESSQPVFGALASLDAASGETVKTALTDERGRSLFVGVAPGSYRVRVEMIGKSTATSQLFEVVAGETVTRELRLESSAIMLEGIQVEAEGGRCSVRPEQGMIVADVWEEARKALRAAAFTDDEQLYQYQTERYLREVDRDSKVIRDEQRERSSGYLRTPFESRPAEDLLENGFVQNDGEGDFYFAPDAAVLLSDDFLDTHCFRLARRDADTGGMIGLAFEPVGGRERVPDIAGTLWLDEESYELQWLDYAYRHLDPDLTSPEVGGRVDFRRLPNGAWIVPEWWIRMPKVGRVRAPGGRLQNFLEAYTVAGGVVTEVQEAGGRTVVRAETGTIEGIVLDSTGLEPQRGARVQVVGSAQSVFTGPDGRFAIPGLSPGVYQVSITHARHQMMGFEPEPVVREVVRGGVSSITHVLPSFADLAFEMCRDEGVQEGFGALLGWVREAGGSNPIPGASVQIRWDLVRMRDERTENARITGVTTEGYQVDTDDRGFYRACRIPEDELLTVNAVVDGVELPGDTLRLREFEPARLHIIDVVRRR